MQDFWVSYARKVLRSGYTWAIAGGAFFIGAGLLMEHNGTTAFHYADKYGRQQAGTPGLLYWLGGSIVAAAVGRAVLFRMAEVKAYRDRTGDRLLPED